jgi:1-acyl-sn-glycerol-3-phosphate acyltransferase
LSDAPVVLTQPTLGYHGAWAATRLAFAAYFRERFEGRRHLPATGGVLVLSNHQSFLDIPLLSHAIPRHASFVARDTLAESRFMAWLLRTTGAVLVKRGAADRAALREMVAHLEQGDVLVVFAEGTRSPDGRVQPFRAGALLAARMAKVPIVPCGIRGAIQALPRRAKFPRPFKVAARFGPAIDSAREDALEAARASVIEMVGDGSYGAVPPAD